MSHYFPALFILKQHIIVNQYFCFLTRNDKYPSVFLKQLLVIFKISPMDLHPEISSQIVFLMEILLQHRIWSKPVKGMCDTRIFMLKRSCPVQKEARRLSLSRVLDHPVSWWTVAIARFLHAMIKILNICACLPASPSRSNFKQPLPFAWNKLNSWVTTRFRHSKSSDLHKEFGIRI